MQPVDPPTVAMDARWLISLKCSVAWAPNHLKLGELQRDSTMKKLDLILFSILFSNGLYWKTMGIEY